MNPKNNDIKNVIDKLHSVQFEIACEIKRICELENIHYFLTFGTLLGAIRHNGFIPWDDDMDIGMLREDYNHFLTAFNMYGDKEKFYLETWENEKGFPFSFAKLKRNGTVFNGNAIQRANIHKGIFVDIFPYDNICESERERKQIGNKLNVLNKLLKFKLNYLPSNPNSKGAYFLARIIHIAAYFIPKKVLKNKIKKIEMKYNDLDCFYTVCMSSAYKLRDAVSSECYSKFIMHSFEKGKFLIPEKYDEILTCIYGNYMELPPIMERIPRHFPKEIKFNEKN